MASKSRGGLSKREFKAQGSILKPAKSPILSPAKAKKSAASSISKSPKMPSFDEETRTLAEAQKEYMASLAPSQEETDITNKQQGILMNQEKQTKGIQGEAIASTFQDRQIDRLNQDTSAAVVPLKYQIAALQSQRESRAELARAKSSIAEDSYNRKAKQYETKWKSVQSKTKSNPLDEEYKKLRNAQMEYKLNNPKKTGTKKDTVESILGGTDNWDVAAENAKKKGIPTYTGSKFDAAANKRWNPKKSKAEELKEALRGGKKN